MISHRNAGYDTDDDDSNNNDERPRQQRIYTDRRSHFVTGWSSSVREMRSLARKNEKDGGGAIVMRDILTFACRNDMLLAGTMVDQRIANNVPIPPASTSAADMICAILKGSIVDADIDAARIASSPWLSPIAPQPQTLIDARMIAGRYRSLRSMAHAKRRTLLTLAANVDAGTMDVIDFSVVALLCDPESAHRRAIVYTTTSSTMQSASPLALLFIESVNDGFDKPTILTASSTSVDLAVNYAECLKFMRRCCVDYDGLRADAFVAELRRGVDGTADGSIASGGRPTRQRRVVSSSSLPPPPSPPSVK